MTIHSTTFSKTIPVTYNAYQIKIQNINLKDTNEVNKIIQYLENQGLIQFITNAFQKQINNTSGSFVNSKYYHKKKGKQFLAQKKTNNQTITFINGKQILNFSQFTNSL